MFARGCGPVSVPAARVRFAVNLPVSLPGGWVEVGDPADDQPIGRLVGCLLAAERGEGLLDDLGAGADRRVHQAPALESGVGAHQRLRRRQAVDRL